VIFGNAEDNFCYAEGVVAAMRELGYSAELVYTSRDETLAAIIDSKRDGLDEGCIQ